MLDIKDCPIDSNFVIATMEAADIIKMILNNPSNYDRQGFICLNVVPVVCAKKTKKSRHTAIFEYGEANDDSDEEVSVAIMRWIGENLGKSSISKTAIAFASSTTIEDVCNDEPSKKINVGWLDERGRVGERIIAEAGKKVLDYTERHCGRIGVLDQIRKGKNLPLIVRVKVKNRSSYDDSDFYD